MFLNKFLYSQHKITLSVNGIDYVGWLNASIERSLETIAARFNISVGRLANGQWPDIKRQDQIQIKIGSTVVVTGIALVADPFYSGHDDYGIRVEGRDRAGDLITGAAIYKGGQWRNIKVDKIAKDLCKPYGIEVVVDENVDIGKPLNKFKVQNGESVADAISRACKYRGVLVTRNNEGNVLLTTAGNKPAPAGLVLGQNIISMEPLGTDGQRCSKYIVQGQGEINHQGDAKKAHQLEFKAYDKEIKRHLPCVIQADDGGDKEHMQKLAEHTARIRAGKAYSYIFTVEGWEANGLVWEPNQLVSITDPVLGFEFEPLLIVSTNVTISRNGGDITELTVAPKEAYEQLPLPEEIESVKKSKEAGKKTGDIDWT